MTNDMWNTTEYISNRTNDTLDMVEDTWDMTGDIWDVTEEICTWCLTPAVHGNRPRDENEEIEENAERRK